MIDSRSSASVLRRLIFVGVGAAVLTSAGCPAEQLAPPPQHDLSPAACGTIDGEAALSNDGQFETGVAEVAFSVDPNASTLTYDLTDSSGDDVGQIEHRVRVEGTLRPTLVAESVLTEGGAEVASQVSRYTPGPNFVRVQTVTREGNTEVLLEWAIREDAVVPFARLLYRDDGASAGDGVVRRLDGTWRVLPIYDDGEPLVTPTEATAFVEEAGLFGESSTGHAWRLMRTSIDPGLIATLNARAETCDRASAKDAEFQLAGASSVTQAVSCEKDGGPLGDVLTIAGGLLTVFDAGVGTQIAAPAAAGRFGASGLGLAMAIGTAAGVTTGAGAVLAIVAGVGIAYGIGVAVDAAVGGNLDSIINGVGTAVLGADEGRSQAISEFYGRGGGSTGDPHLTTLDGETYDLHAAGEVVLVRANTGGRFEVQARQGPADGACPGVAFNHAVAAAIGEHTFFAQGSASGGAPTLRVDGQEIDLLDGDVLTFDDGTMVLVDDAHHIVLQSAEGDSVLVRRSAYVHLYFSWESGRTASGLLGNGNGVVGDDFLLPPGVAASFEHLHGAFVDTFRVDDDSSLFFYEAGEGPADFVIDSFPGEPTRLSDLPADDVTAATDACVAAGITHPTALNDCALDLACSLEADADELIDAHAVRAPEASAVVLDPVSLEGWIQTGDPGAGTWEVSDDGRSVLQVNNGDPTFFVSPDTYLGARIEGTLSPGASDDDLIGFVFGYQAPLPPNDDPVTYDTFIVTWKGVEQGDAPEGLRLMHVHGTTADVGIDPVFWAADETSVVEILDEDIGPDTGWRNKPVRFSLLYTADRISVSIDGEERLSLNAADSQYAFASGRFGFFNYSQPNTGYADFTVGPPTPTPQRASCSLTYSTVDGANIVEDTTWGDSCTQIVVGRDVNVTGGRLSIVPGTTLVMEAGMAISVRDSGALLMEGTEAQPIRVVGSEPTAGHWGGIAIETNSVNNRLAWVDLRHTGASGFQFNEDALIVTGPTTTQGRVSITDCTFAEHSGDGVSLWAGALLDAFERNTFIDIDDRPLRVPVDLAHLIGADSSFVDAGDDAAVTMISPVAASGVSTSVTWHRLDVPWLLESGDFEVLGEGTVLTLEPGIELRFDDAGLDAATGAISAVGTADAPIVFRGVNDTPGDWRGLYFRNTSSANLLEHVEIRHAGAAGFQFESTSIIVTGNGTTPGAVTVRDSVVADSAGAGVIVRSGGTFVEENVTYEGNAGDDVVDNN